MLNPEEVNQVADFVLALGSDAADSHTGKEKYMQVCFACHGPDGTGNVLLGAPNLTDSTWLYGSEKDAIIEAINNGRNGVMPAFNEMLDDTQIKLLVAWLAR
jgi:cytochrome c oxidase cbb3-type subunit 3